MASKARKSSAIRDRILAVKDIKTKLVVVPDWDNEEINLVGLTGSERLEVVAKSIVTTADDEGNKTSREDQGLLYANLITKAAHDPTTGEPIFDEGDIGAIGDKSAGVIQDLAMEILNLSGMTAGSAKVIAKNSVPTPSVDTASV